jgi:protein farnesyltransferase/geranylgeranyltransferase type-1 subunit alpha
MSADERAAYASYRFLETSVWRTFTEPQQREFWKLVADQGVPQPLPKPRDLGKDSRGRDIGSYTPEEYRAYQKRGEELARFRRESEKFTRESGREKGLVEEPRLTEERNRRKVIGGLRGKAMGRYEGNPEWDDVVPIPQDDGEGALAQIAYTDEYAEGWSLRPGRVTMSNGTQ